MDYTSVWPATLLKTVLAKNAKKQFLGTNFEFEQSKNIMLY